MAVPGLPVPSTIGSSSRHSNSLTGRRRAASKSLSNLVSNAPNLRRRLLYGLLVLSIFLLGKRYGHTRTAPPRLPFAVDVLPPPPTPPPLEYSSEAMLSGARKVPPIVHYVFGMKEDFGGKPFGFVQFVTINSMLENIRPEKVMFWHRHEPTGWWFQKIQEFAQKKGVKWEMKKAREVDEIFGNKVEHFAHKADIIRLEALKQYGGIYLDTDVFIIRDFAPFYGHATVMGMESQPDLTQELPTGICNAIILSQPYSPFISRWLDSYADFDRSLWATHSVARPWELARQYPSEITILNKYAFFWPLWHDDHMQLVHRSINYDFDKSGQFAYHGWESLAWGWLAQLDPDTIWIYGSRENGEPGETSLTRLARRWVPGDLRNEWREAKAKGLVD